MQQLSPETPLLEFRRKPSSTSSTSTSPTSASTSTGRTLLVLASQHGDEPCGVLAVNQLLRSSLSPSSSSWTPFTGEKECCAFDRVLFALGNPRAFAANKRQVDENLNRCFPVEKTLNEMMLEEEERASSSSSSSSSSYERTRAVEIAQLLSRADAVLDLHSASAPSPPFAMFPPRSEASASFARVFRGIPYALRDFTGEGLGLAIEWSAKHGKGSGSGSEGGGGGNETAAVTLEAGQHSSPSSVEASVLSIRAALRWRGLGRELEGEEALGCRPKVLVIKKGEVVRGGFRWETKDSKPPDAFSRFEFGQVVARDDVKGQMRCDLEKGGALLVLPTATPVEGEDAFLWGEEKEEEEEEEA